MPQVMILWHLFELGLIHILYRYIFIQLNQNTGFAEGNNVGIRYAFQNKFEYVLLLNNDTVIPEDLIRKTC